MRDYAQTRDTRVVFDEAAEEYVRYLRAEHPEHFMESTDQATQRKITVESLDLLAAERSDVHVYSELLVQWRDEENRIRQVVPDNMVVIAPRPPQARTSFALPLVKARPFWVMEYISKSNPRKDYQKSFDKYETELKVPYFLMFHPDGQELSLYHLKRGERKYVSVKPNRQGRYAVPRLDIEVAIVEGWIRFWWKDRLLPLPADLQRENDVLKQQLNDQARQMAEMRAELDRLRASG